MSGDAEEMRALLARLEAKREALNGIIDNLKIFLGLEEGGGAPAGGGFGLPREVRSDSFLGRTIPDAAKMYLQIVRRPQTTQQIADALQKGGMETKSANFLNTVQTILRRVENQGGDIVRIPSGEWGLGEWYPNLQRRRRGSGKGKDAAEADDAQDALATPSEHAAEEGGL